MNRHSRSFLQSMVTYLKKYTVSNPKKNCNINSVS